MVTVIIPSASAENLIRCVGAIRQRDPEVRIVVVDDGARQQAEALLPDVSWIRGVKPFVFSRNVNLGVGACDSGVIVLGDDGLLETERGFSHLAEAGRDFNGILSAGIRGAVGNINQRWNPSLGSQITPEKQVLCFIAVFIPRRVWASVGQMDERYVGYGYDDNDYCRRVIDSGGKLGVFHGCVVEHGTLESVFQKTVHRSLAVNREIHQAKWQASS